MTDLSEIAAAPGAVASATDAAGCWVDALRQPEFVDDKVSERYGEHGNNRSVEPLPGEPAEGLPVRDFHRRLLALWGDLVHFTRTDCGTLETSHITPPPPITWVAARYQSPFDVRPPRRALSPRELLPRAVLSCHAADARYELPESDPTPPFAPFRSNVISRAKAQHR